MKTRWTEGYTRYVGGHKIVFHDSVHMSRAAISKITKRAHGHCLDFKLYELTQGYITNPVHLGTTQKELQWENGQQLFDYYSQFCTCQQTKTAMLDIETIGQEEIITHTFSTCPVNTIGAVLARHLGTEQYPTLKYQHEFSQFMYKLYKEIIPLIKQKVSETSYSLQDHYLQYTGSKKQDVIDGVLAILSGKPYVTVMKCFVKTGEWNQTTQQNFIDGDVEGRSRQIFGPHKTLKGFPGFYNKRMLVVMKTITQSFICGYNNIKLARLVTRDIFDLAALWGLKCLKVLTFDGSAHDSNQMQCLIEAVDNRMHEELVGLVLAQLGMPKDVIDKTLSVIIKPEYQMYATARVDNQQRYVYSGSLTGTTYSGHPTKTTLGNTLRVISFVCFYIYQGFGLQEAINTYLHTSKKFRLYVAGDDVQILGEEKSIEILSKIIQQGHAPNATTGIYGLGQVAKEIQINEWDYFDFLSKDGYFTHEMVLTRKAERVINKGHYTHKISFGTSKRSQAKAVKAQNLILGSIISQNVCWSNGIQLYDAYFKRYLNYHTKAQKLQITKNLKPLIEMLKLESHYRGCDDVLNENWENNYYAMLDKKYGKTIGHVINLVNDYEKMIRTRF